MYTPKPKSTYPITTNRRLTPAILAFCLSIGSVFAMEVNLKWNTNPEPDIAGYVVHYGTRSGALDQVHYTEKVTSTTLGGLEPSTTYYLALQAYNTAGLFSELTSEIIHTTQEPSSAGLEIRDQAGNLLPNDGQALDLGPALTGSMGEERAFTLTNHGPETVAGLRWFVEDAGAENFIIEGIPVVALVNTNSSFEKDFVGWSTSGQLRTRPSSTATHGENLVDFSHGDGPNDGTLQTSFPTVPGKSYQLEFDLGILSYNTSLQRISASVDGEKNLLSEILEIRGVGAGLTVWKPKSFAFTADSAITTLRFADISDTTSGVDLNLDHVRVIDVAASTGTVGITLPAGASATFSIRFKPTHSGERSAELRLMTDDNREDAYRFVLHASGILSYDDWLALRQAEDPAGSAGENPLLDYAFGLRPEKTAGNSLAYANGLVISRGKPIALTPAQTGGDFRGVFVRMKDRDTTGLVYRPQFSPDLMNWHDADDVPTLLADDAEVEIVSHSASDTLDGKPARFFRVGILLATAN